MSVNFLLSNTLSDFQLKLLDLTQYLHGEVNGGTITLQYSYITALLQCSYRTVSDGIQRLCDAGLLDRVSNNYGECAEYRYNPSVYRSMVKASKERPCNLMTGRKKRRQQTTAGAVLGYMSGKAKAKASKTHRNSPCKPPSEPT